MTDWQTEARQAWLKAGAPQAPDKPLIYRRHADGTPVLRYVPASEQGPDYLRQRFAAMQGDG